MVGSGRNARGAFALVLAGALLGLAGCASGQVAPPIGLEVELVQQRSDVADRTAQVRLVNGSDVDLVVTRLELRDEWFAGPAVRERRSTVAAGRTVDLRVDLPVSACVGEPGQADRVSEVWLALEGIGEVVVEAGDPLDFLAPLHARECLAQDAAAIAEIGVVGFDPAPAGAPGTLRIGVTPEAVGGEFELLELRTTNLLRFDLAASAPWALAMSISGQGPPTEIEVPLVPGRCDPHAVMEDKRGTVFGLLIRIGAQEGVIELAAPAEVKAAMLAWVADWCGFSR